MTALLGWFPWRIPRYPTRKPWLCIVKGCDKPAAPEIERAPGSPFCGDHEWEDYRESWDL